MNSNAPILEPGFEGVLDVFTQLLNDGDEVGASLSVWRDGVPLLEVHGGYAGLGRPWQPDTLAMTYSTGKPIAALAALKAVRDGLLDLDTPVEHWWPTFATRGKESTTLRHILSHTAGLPTFSEHALQVDPTDKPALIQDLIDQEPRWRPGAVIAEHAATYGHLIDGALAAVGAEDVATATEALAAELGIDLHFGLNPGDQGRIADLTIIDDGFTAEYLERDLGSAALSNPIGVLDPAFTNTAKWRACSFPAIGLCTNATSLARFYDDLGRTDGAVAHYLGPEMYREFLTAQATGHDHFLDSPASWSLGLRVDDGEFGMGGIGGSGGWFVPARNYSMAYVTRGLGTFERVDLLSGAVEDALGTTKLTSTPS